MAEEASWLLNSGVACYAPAAAPSVAVRYHHQELAWPDKAKKEKNRGISVKTVCWTVLHASSGCQPQIVRTLAVSGVYPYLQT